MPRAYLREAANVCSAKPPKMEALGALTGNSPAALWAGPALPLTALRAASLSSRARALLTQLYRSGLTAPEEAVASSGA